MSKKRTRKTGNPCQTFWGSHGCKKQAGHQNRCVCDCNAGIPEGAVLDPVSNMYYVPDPTGNNYGLGEW